MLLIETDVSTPLIQKTKQPKRNHQLIKSVSLFFFATDKELEEPDARPRSKRPSGSQSVCEIGGCSGHICDVDASKMITTCEYKCEYGCLKYQKCTHTKKGGCKWKTKKKYQTDYDNCMENCACTLSADTGPCKAAFNRYYYNQFTGQCETFTYGGCKGNANNFQTLSECLSICK
eukprot:338614_1